MYMRGSIGYVVSVWALHTRPGHVAASSLAFRPTSGFDNDATAVGKDWSAKSPRIASSPVCCVCRDMPGLLSSSIGVVSQGRFNVLQILSLQRIPISTGRTSSEIIVHVLFCGCMARMFMLPVHVENSLNVVAPPAPATQRATVQRYWLLGTHQTQNIAAHDSPIPPSLGPRIHLVRGPGGANPPCNNSDSWYPPIRSNTRLPFQLSPLPIPSSSRISNLLLILLPGPCRFPRIHR